MLIDGTGNKIYGSGFLGNDITFQDSDTELTLGINGFALSDIFLNGGILVFGKDLSLGPNAQIKNDGLVNLSSNKLSFGISDLTISDSLYFNGNNGVISLNSNVSLSATWTFSGTCVLEGGGNVLNLYPDGMLFVQPNSTLILKNIILDGIKDNSITCSNNTSKLVLENMAWIQDGDYHFTKGSIKFKKEVSFIGQNKVFSYESDLTSTVDYKSRLKVSENVTFSAGRRNGEEPLYFEDHTATLRLENCTFNVTPSGIRIDRGTFEFNHNVTIDLNSTDTNTGMILGNGEEPEGTFEFFPAAKLLINPGYVVFDSIDPTSLRSRSQDTRFFRKDGGYLHIQKNLTISNMTVCAGYSSFITMEDGVTVIYKDTIMKGPDWDFDLTGTLYNQYTILLDGNDSIFLSKGTLLLYLLVNGINNKIHGTGYVGGVITFQNSDTQLLFNLNGSLLEDVYLNGGTFLLNNNLQIGQGKFFKNDGIVNLSKYELSLSDKSLNATDPVYFDGNSGTINLNSTVSLSNTWTFSGVCTLNSNGNTLDLQSLGALVVESGSTLILKDLVISGVGGQNIKCLDDSGIVVFQNVGLILDNNYTFSLGQINFNEKCLIKGSHVFEYQTGQSSTIAFQTKLHFDSGVTFSYAPWTNDKELLAFSDDTSILSLKDSTLYAQTKGLQLTKGKIIINGIVNLEADSDSYITTTIIEGVDFFEEPITVTLTNTYYVGEGITFGDGDFYNDFICNIKSGAKLIINKGIFAYKNIELSSMNAVRYSNIKIGEYAELDLYEDMDIGNAIIEFASNSTFKAAKQKKILGSMHFEGNVYKKPLIV